MAGVTATWAGWDGATVTVGPTAAQGSAAATWAGWDGAQVSVGDQVSVAVYDQTGKTFQSVAQSAKATYRIALGGSGDTGSLQLLINDVAAPFLTDRAIVKATCRGRTEGFRVNGESAQLATDGNGWVTFGNMPSLIGCLHDSPVYPDGGLPAGGAIDKGAATTRAFGPMSPRGPWYVPSDWVHPLGVTIADTTTTRTGYPKELAAVPEVYWIAPPPGPAATQPAGAINHFRREFTTSAAASVEFVFAADNYLSLWLDGIEIIAPDYAGQYNWKGTYTYQTLLQPGAHVLYARVENAPRSSGTNPMGLVGAVFYLDANGNRGPVPLERTHPAFWLSTANDVGWYPGQILHQVMRESQAAGDAGPSNLRVTFAPTQDSAGVPWSGTRVTKLFNVMTDMVDDVIAMLSQDGMDVVAGAAGMTLDAYNRLGKDVSATEQLQLGRDGGNLIRYDTTTTGTRANCIAAQLADGRWHTLTDTAGLAALGGKRVWLNVQLGSTVSPTAAEVTMRQMLAETAAPVTAATAQPSTLTGTQFLRSYGLGDSIKTPDKRASGSTIKQRVFAYNVDGTNDVTNIWPEFIQDKT